MRPAVNPPKWWPDPSKKQKDRGIGDTVARLLAKVGGNRYKSWRKRIGKPCNCGKRQAALNKLFPYNTSHTSVISDTSVASQTANNESLDSVRD